MNQITLLARRIKHQEAIGCIDSGVPELVRWGKSILARKYTKEELIGDE